MQEEKEVMYKISKFSLIFIVIILILMFALCIICIVGIAKNSKCTQNPLVYGAKEFYNTGFPLECICQIEKENYAPLYFNEMGIKAFTIPDIAGNISNTSTNVFNLST